MTTAADPFTCDHPVVLAHRDGTRECVVCEEVITTIQPEPAAGQITLNCGFPAPAGDHRCAGCARQRRSPRQQGLFESPRK